MLTIIVDHFGHDDIHKFQMALDIRTKVFVEEQRVDQAIEFDGNDHVCTHCLIWVNQHPVGTCRWRQTTKGMKLERFAVLPEYRGMGFGLILLKYALDEVIPKKQVIYLHAQTYVTGFYSKHGFAPVGTRFAEANIEHIKMEYVGKHSVI